MQTKHYPVAILCGLLAVVGSIYLNTLVGKSAPADPKTLLAEISTSRYLNHDKFLASDDLKGRGNGTPELEKAADYIAAQFRTYGLKPAGESDSYFQKLEVTTGSEFGAKNSLTLDDAAVKAGDDFVPISFSNTSAADSAVVFVGYGITAPDMHYDDYQGIDVTGKVVVAFRHEPQETDPKSPFNGTSFTSHASFVNKAINARQHGAKGIVFINDPANHTKDEDVVGAATRDIESDDMNIAAVHSRYAAVVTLFAKSRKDLLAIQKKIDTDLKPQSFELADHKIAISTDVVRTRKTVRNVLAAVAGSDPELRNQWLIVGAHYDHLGLGGRYSLAPSLTGQIHHGADDNASGTSGVLELARLVSQNKLKRSVLFMTFAGEELGLLGSSYFANHPTVSINKVAAMINMDMIGRLQNDRLFVGGVGTSPKFKGWVEEANQTAGLKVDYSDSGFGSSDHTSFTVKHIPVLFFFSGLHTDYHKPSDTSDKINGDGAKKVLSLAFLMLDRIANDDARPLYTEVVQPQPTSGGGGGGYGPSFGSVPDFRDDLKGVLFADVRPNSPAAKAGLKGGDLMTSFDGVTINNLNDFSFALGRKKPGDVVVVIVKRNGQDLKVNVTLEARK